MTKAELRQKLEALSGALLDEAVRVGNELETKEKTAILQAAKGVYELLHKQDASGKKEDSAYVGYAERLAATAPGGGKRTRNGSGPYRNAEAEQ